MGGHENLSEGVRGMKPITLADANVRNVNVIQMIEVIFTRGAGVEGDPVREIIQYWKMDGTLLVEKDTWLESKTE
jgi:hypothetical protein